MNSLQVMLPVDVIDFWFIFLVRTFVHQAFVHVSSLFTNPSVLDVYEQFYKSPIPASTVIQMAETFPDYILNGLTSGQVQLTHELRP